MKNDHSSDVEFVTLNYGLRTTPRIEWNTVLNVDKNKEINGRIIPDYRVLLDSPTANRAKTKLVDCEIVATILYTGPMGRSQHFWRSFPSLDLVSDPTFREQYQIYNMVLRKWPAEGLKALNDNTFATTIHCLVSAVTKISRVTRIHDGLLLYRGLGGVRLPDSFYRASEAGFKCFVEWGFMSTTSHKSIAVQYTGIAKGRSYPTLLQVQRSRGFGMPFLAAPVAPCFRPGPQMRAVGLTMCFARRPFTTNRCARRRWTTGRTSASFRSTQGSRSFFGTRSAWSSPTAGPSWRIRLRVS